MKLKLSVLLFISFLSVNAYAGNAAQNTNQATNEKSAGGKIEKSSETADKFSVENGAEKFDANKSEAEESQTNQPKTVRDFFMLLPEKYFVLEGCERFKDKHCRKAKLDYLKTFAEVEDTANGYLKGGCDGAQSCLEMALFKRPDNSYIVGLATVDEMTNDYYFIEYKNGNWSDVSAKIVPKFSKKNMYELPRKGTTIEVFARKTTGIGDDYETGEKGAKLYDLEWKNGKFTVKK